MTSESPLISVLVPALNEQETIREVVDRLLALGPGVQVVVIDDGSTDRTAEILREYAARITIVTNPTRSGKGMAIRRGLEKATGNVVIIQDADLEYFPEQIPDLVQPILDGKCDVVYGTRFAEGMPAGMALPNKIVNRWLALATRILYHQQITDEATCYKAIRRTLLVKADLQCTGFEFCPEVTAKVSRMALKIHETPIQYEPRTKNAGKKIRWTDAPIAFWTLARYRFWSPKSDASAETLSDKPQ